MCSINQKVLFGALVLDIFSFSAFGAAPPEHSPGKGSTSLSAGSASSKKYCSLKTLKGTYTYSISGAIESGLVSLRESGVAVYDGKGTVRFKATRSTSPGLVKSFFQASATYVINSDCTGQLLSSNVPYEDIFVSPDGSFFSFISTSEGVQLNGVEQRMTKQLINSD